MRPTTPIARLRDERRTLADMPLTDPSTRDAIVEEFVVGITPRVLAYVAQQWRDEFTGHGFNAERYELLREIDSGLGFYRRDLLSAPWDPQALPVLRRVLMLLGHLQFLAEQEEAFGEVEE